MQKKNNKGIIALIIVLVLAAAELGVDSQPVADGDVYDFVLNVGW